ncbi:MAG: CoA transferase [Alphaproteobacteria bacterium]|nr:CoA transferase [Alphaproteobacteria bacterium]
MMLPLEGIRIIAVEQYGAGPFGTMQLADLGAEVVKVENIAEGGDVGRFVRHPKDPLPDGDSLFFQAFNRNKKSLALDLKQEAGQEVLRDLVRSADGLLDNLRGDRPAKLGLTYEALKGVNPAIVCVHLSAYGREGPRAAWPGYDYLMQAEAGYLSLTGEPSSPPARMGLSTVDLATGVQAALAMTSGLLAARADGKGMDLDVSLYDTAMSNLGYLACWYLTAGIVQGREPRSSHPNLTPSQLYRTRDGWLFIMCNKEKFWGELADALGHPEWKDDPCFRDFAARLANRGAVTEALDEALAAKTTAEWLEELQGRVPVAPVYDIAGALDASFPTETGRHLWVDHPTGRWVGSVSPAIQTGEAPPARPAPALGADTEDMLTSLGYSPERIATLRAANVI